MREFFHSSSTHWNVLGKSIVGAQHLRTGASNQDAINWSAKNKLPLILAVSDGHGHAKYFRSAKGAELAVNTAIEVLTGFLHRKLSGSFLEKYLKYNSISIIKNDLEEQIPKTLVREWRKEVAHHFQDHPFSPEELNNLETKAGAKSRRIIEAEPVLAYGATLLAVGITDQYIIYLQLGDGDILTLFPPDEAILTAAQPDFLEKPNSNPELAPEGTKNSKLMISRPIFKDDRLIANETTSLCSPDAWRDFKTCFQSVTKAPPGLILVSTDGYANSFQNEEGFQQVGLDIYESIKMNGLTFIEKNLETWLKESSQFGSGDDITLGIICNPKVLKNFSLNMA